MHYRYADFRQRCRAYRPSELVPAIAAIAARQGEPPYSDFVKTRFPPWGLAAAARESLLYGNEFRSGLIHERTIETLMHFFQESADIPLAEQNSSDFVLAMITRLTYEQFPWQESIFEEVARSHAWLVEGLPNIEAEVISETSMHDMLGMSLRDAIGATFVLAVGAQRNNGVYIQSWLNQPNFSRVLDLYPKANIELTAAKLTTTIPAFKAEHNRLTAGVRHLDRFDYNPLIATPFVVVHDDRPPVSPSPRLILRTVSPLGLYYTGVQAHGSAFTRDLGLLFEQYIGRQLEQIPNAEIFPEIKYGPHGGLKSIDWFVITPGLVVLLELKSARLDPNSRAGDPEKLYTALGRSLDKAHKQLVRTITALDENRREFSHIPKGLPILALAVTAEPFYTGSGYIMATYGPVISTGQFEVPVSVISARDVEALVTHESDFEELILDAMNRRTPDAVFRLSPEESAPPRRNTVLDEAWKSYPWPSD